jgi:hypothetical protein
MLRLRHPISLLLITLLVMLGVLRSHTTPSAVDAGAPDVVFSAVRAEAILRYLLPGNLPHESGSEANRGVRERVIAQFRSFGYQPEIQSRFHCNPQFGSCSPVENVIAVKPGAVGRYAVLVTAHYDSTWAGPGAADDGAGVAALLEIARMSAEFPAFDNDVIFLISDAEENGLIGAHAFAEHHPLFAKVKMVINLEARGVEGPSAMFETGEGNRSVIRMLAKNVKRPVSSSLAYEVYKRMPNDTDYSVYKRRGVMGVNFAFTRGVALYHSALDDPDHLDYGSLQHHGDNAWGMLKAFGERDLTSIYHAEDAGFIDVFGLGLAHYPVSIAGGLALVLGVWVMLAISLAFRKEFRYRQLRWGLIAIPLMLAAIVAGGYLLSWPLGRWPDAHPLEHPYPWVGRCTLFLMAGLVIFSTLKLFSGRVSACAWMVLAWALVFLLGLVLASQMPAAAYLALLPLALFALGSVIDLFRKKSPAPLLMASLFGFATAAFISFYHFFMLNAVMSFDRSVYLVAPLVLACATVMPMLLAYVRNRELSWRPAKWMLVAILAGCLIHLFLPGYTADRPRDMALMYSEVEGDPSGIVALDSVLERPDRAYARSHGFEPLEMNNGSLGSVVRPARKVAALNLPGVAITAGPAVAGQSGWHRRLVLESPLAQRFLQISVAPEAGLRQVWVNGELALDTSIETKRPRQRFSVRLIHPAAGPLDVDILTATPDAFTIAVLTWHDLPGVLTAPFLGNWPDDAQPAYYGPRAEKIQRFTVPAAD